ncbi:Com family DNA-binding transcriptional regulator [Acidovorax sp. GBBC 3332]|nr:MULTISPECIES: Com family DNA-binding transcriptional regulator [unclassified Acidovorax]MDA8449854.1 Com family DNA-binding transcriptional regulator [Acidovorax sp. GBBC 3297]MDA8459299.1 Com family DNA-binding transcriptional regulator [Acidovorax sp. GBBC 3333]MDA8464336.1 Com family DNA-binding transcriptional regulator [Acidovorax sp. GBBC 3332]MDA8469453.1 Com family DNA-binding transcriptional regulator [Acidovorax sp. GBBC 3299]
MTEIRCGSCRRKLGEGEYTRLAIKCPRCGALNTLRAMSPPPARHRAPDPQGQSIGNPKSESADAASAR